jgi:hypothetical protein
MAMNVSADVAYVKTLCGYDIRRRINETAGIKPLHRHGQQVQTPWHEHWCISYRVAIMDHAKEKIIGLFNLP